MKMQNFDFNAGQVPAMFSNPEFGSVRIIVKENGEPLFCGKDVATCLGYSDQAQAVRDRIDDEDKVVVEITTSYGIKPTTFINESGLYSLILGSKLDSTKKFKRWVTSEVLPSIRKTGSYSVSQQQSSYQIPQTFSEALQLAADIQKENERLALENKKQAKEVTKLNSKIENDAPKVEMYNDLINSHDCISTTELAKIYKMSTMKFNAEMRTHGLYRALDNLPLQKSINAGVFIVKEVPYTDKAGKKRINSKVYVTPKGQELIHNMFKVWEEYSGLFGD